MRGGNVVMAFITCIYNSVTSVIKVELGKRYRALNANWWSFTASVSTAVGLLQDVIRPVTMSELAGKFGSGEILVP